MGRRRYKGWWLFAPVWITDPETEGPLVEPRGGRWAVLLYDLASWLDTRVLIPTCSFLDPDWEPCFAFRVGSEFEEVG